MNADENIKVSVILPVYNVEPYIGRCIESLQTQTMRELEFIFVDDCSTDKSMAAVETWAKEDSRVRILRNEENIGAGPSRNRGIEVARGEYLSFVDPDDYVSPDFYELLFAVAVADGGHDIAKGLCCIVNQDGNKDSSCSERFNRKILTYRSTGKPLYRTFNLEHQMALYRRSLFVEDTVRYGITRNAEDITFLLRCCYQTEDIVFEESATYYYVQRVDSATRGPGMERTHGELDALSEMIDFFEIKGFDKEACRYLIDKAQARLKRFHELLDEGRVKHSDYDSVVERLLVLLQRIPNADEACKNELLYGTAIVDDRHDSAKSLQANALTLKLRIVQWLKTYRRFGAKESARMVIQKLKNRMLG